MAKYPGYSSRRHYVELKQRVEEEIDRLNPRLRELAEGDVEVISVDEKTGTVTLRIFGGRLH
jgi:Fe-S cluster biogenesis protein NfuA